MKRIVFTILILLMYGCERKDYYSEIKRDCNLEKAERILSTLLSREDPQSIKVIDAISECNSDIMDKFLSDIYNRSDEKIKRHIYLRLIEKRSKAFLETAFNILINKVQTNEDYSGELKYINETDPEFIEKKYKELTHQIEEAKKNKNRLGLEILLDNIKALSTLMGKGIDEDGILKDINRLSREEEKESLYSKFIDATNNQEMTKAYNIFKRLKEHNLILKGDNATNLEEILRQLSETEDKFYETSLRLDGLMIEIEKGRREGNTNDVKRLEEELRSVKSDMVFKKRALDRAAKRLPRVRELFEQVRVK
ncbi:MAG: hypothetical protein ACP5QK_00435 [Myxococcota bacterium]